MEQEILNILKKMGVFIVVAQTLIHFCPNIHYEKYIKMIVGVMTISMLVLPIFNFIFKGDFNRYAMRLAQLEYEFNMAVEQVELSQTPSQEVLEEQILMETQEKLKTGFNNLLREDDYLVEKVLFVDIGERYKINVWLTKQSHELVSLVEEVKIQQVEIESSQDNITSSYGKDYEIMFAQFLGISSSDIEVMINE